MTGQDATETTNVRSQVTIALIVTLVVAAVIGTFIFLDNRGGSDDPVGAEAAAGPSAPADDADRTEDATSTAGTSLAPSPAPVAGTETETRDPESCGQVTVWAAPELLPAVESAAARAGDDCFSYAVVSRETATAQAALRDGDTPHVWLPSSTAWAQLVQQDGVDLQIGETVASSPVLLTGHPELMAALSEIGVSPASTFGDLVQQYQQAAVTGGSDLSLRLGDPRTEAASMALLSATADQLGDLSAPGSPGRTMLVLLAQSSIRGNPLAVLRSEPATLVPATEQQLGQAVAEGQELSGVALQGGVGTVLMPFVRVGDAGSTEVVDALEQELVSDAAAADLRELHLRAGAEGEGPDVTAVLGTVETDGQAPPAEVTATLAQTWAVIAPQSRILTLIDISGSMQAVVDEDITRIDLTRQAAQTALTLVPDQTAIGLWYFATSLDGDTDHRAVVPVRPLNEEVRSGVSQQDVLLAETERLDLGILQGDTGLHDSLWAAYEHMRSTYSPEAISSVLMLTDGINDDSTGGLSEQEVIGLLTEAREAGDRPVTVVLIGMGPEVNAEALERLATAAGGESFVLRDPRELVQVFVDVVARRAP